MNRKNLIIAVSCLMLSGMIRSQTAPIEIRTAEELASLNTDAASLSGNYILMNDITLDEWTPVGSIGERNEQGFSGTFDGNGYTITIINFRNEEASVGLFGLIEEKGTVKNLCITGNIRYTGIAKILYIGGIAGVNYGLITGCSAKIAIEANNDATASKKKLKTLFGYESGAYGGCIAGINVGTITNCYSIGSILVSERKTTGYAGGITGGNGQPISGGIGIGIGSGGIGISVNSGNMKIRAFISHCYSTASALSNGSMVGGSGGIAAYNHPSGAITKCVSLNRNVEANGKNRSVATPVASIGLTYYRNPDVYYKDDIVIRKYKNGNAQESKEFSKKNAIAFAYTQQESWWRYQEDLSEKQRKQQFGFSFGDSEQSPWIWNDKAKRPVLYWEKTEIDDIPELQLQSIFEQSTIGAQNLDDSDIEWIVENNMLFVSGIGDIPGNPEWSDEISTVTDVVIDDGITCIGQRAFAMSKIVSITIGKDVTSLKSYALFNCNNLKTMEIKNATPPKVGAFAFLSTPVSKAKLIVPAGTKAVYEKNKDWKKFGIIEESDE
ncbi:MAG: leucine-rich repeat domain-containing protein [Prevotellaceae bacterium]|jgi:hypothetical protein|nr:leucine-rich repeat domain-containing protein [Prevotellaceae bacterium]